MKSVSICSAVALVIGVSLSACSSASPNKGDDLEETSQAYSSWSAQWTFVGSLDYGQKSAAVHYANPARYRAFKFAGNKGDNVDIWVRSTNGGDSVAWLLDNDFKVLATNDDAAGGGTLDSHIKHTLPANASATHYIAFRDYDLSPATFTVDLEGAPKDLRACTKDADCVRVRQNCCSNIGPWTAVTKGDEAAFKATLNCATPTFCPAILTLDDQTTAECNTGTHECEAVKPADIACGGHSVNAHACPTKFTCEGPQLASDGTGSCVKRCGGIAGIACTGFNEVCVDDPNDSCNPATGGADCGGICQIPTP